MVAGFTLAKTILDRDDQDLAIEQLVEPVAHRCEAHREELSASSSKARRDVMRQAASLLRHPFDAGRADSMPSRANMWLAADVSRSIGKSWLKAAPKARRRFRPSGALLETLRSTVRCPEPKQRQAIATAEIVSLREARCLE